MHQSLTFPQLETTHCNAITAPGFCNRKSQILAHIERDLINPYLTKI